MFSIPVLDGLTTDELTHVADEWFDLAGEQRFRFDSS